MYDYTVLPRSISQILDELGGEIQYAFAFVWEKNFYNTFSFIFIFDIKYWPVTYVLFSI